MLSKAAPDGSCLGRATRKVADFGKKVVKVVCYVPRKCCEKCCNCTGRSFRTCAEYWFAVFLIVLIAYFLAIAFSPKFRVATGWMGSQMQSASSAVGTVVWGDSAS
jgi:hypothetical protein